MRYIFLLFFCTLFFGMPAYANIRLPAILSDNMILQRDRPIAIWGFADPGELVGIKFGEQGAVSKADSKGHWLAMLKPVGAGGPYTLTVHGKTEVTLKNILVGEVWLVSGESNISAPYATCEHGDATVETDSQFRLFKVPENVAEKPLLTIESSWKDCSPQSVPSFSYIGYAIGRELSHQLHIPVGIIQATYPNAKIETWVSREFADKSSEFGSIGSKAENAIAEDKAAQTKYEILLADWDERASAARKANKPEPPQPLAPEDAKLQLVGSAYNGEIAPIEPYTIRGVFWYQGEHDAGLQLAHRWQGLFTLMLQDWRERFKSASMPIVYVQLPDVGKQRKAPHSSFYAELREAQAKCRRIPYAYMVVAIDTAAGANADRNPPDKREIATRMVRAALATQYRIRLPYASPIFDSMEPLGSKIVVHFRYAEGGLISKGLPVRGFEVAGADQFFYRASAVVEGDKVTVSSDKVEHPIAVRYDWADNPIGNLYNADKLPVCPFRTDNWKDMPKVDPKKGGAAKPGFDAKPTPAKTAPSTDD